MRRRVPAVLFATALLAGCGGGHHRESPSYRERTTSYECTPPDFPDAVPRNEPVSKYGNPETYRVYGVSYHVMKSGRGYKERGLASWYGSDFHGKRTSSGEPYDMNQMTAAHKTLPLPSYVLVTNLDNNRQALVRVNDRGPFHENRIIDLSYAAAQKLCVVRNGTARVEVEAIDPDTYTGRLVAARNADSDAATQTPQPPSTDDEIGDGAAVPIAPVAGAAVTVSEDEQQGGQQLPPSNTASAPADNIGGFVVEGETDTQPDHNLHKVGAPRPAGEVQEDVQLQSPVAPTLAPTGSLYLQVGAFTQRENADALADKLRKAGLVQIRVIPPESGTGPTRVRLGPYPDPDAMETDRQRLDELGIASRSLRE